MHTVAQIPVDPSHYLTWGWLSVSVPNLIMILLTVGLLVAAIALPFPGGRAIEGGATGPDAGEVAEEVDR